MKFNTQAVLFSLLHLYWTSFIKVTANLFWVILLKDILKYFVFQTSGLKTIERECKVILGAGSFGLAFTSEPLETQFFLSLKKTRAFNLIIIKLPVQ